MQTQTTVLIDSVRFPECPRWYGGRLWFSDFFAHKVLSVDLQGRLELVAELPTMPGGLGWTPEGQLLVVSADDRRLLRLDGDNLVEVADLSALVAHANNDMVVDCQGRAYIGNMGFDFGDPQAVPALGPLLLVTPDGGTRIVAEGLAFPNGMAITADGRTLIVAESYGACLTAFTIEMDGTLSDRRIWAKFDDSLSFEQGRVAPDGLCLDAEGAIWVATTTTREVLRVLEGGTVTHRLKLSNIPLACVLGGVDRRTLFITTTESLNPFESAAKGRIEYLETD